MVRVISPPARWGLLDFMSVASSSCRLLPPASSSSSLSSLSSSSSSSSSSNCDPRSTVFAAGPQPRPSTTSVPCRTSTTTSHAQCSLPDLNHDQPRPVFPAGPQPRVSMPSVPCRTSCRKIWDKECAEEITLLRVIPIMTFIHVLTGTSSGILSDISSDILFGILSGISSGIWSGISSGILSGKSSAILSGISSGTLSDISSGIQSGILSGISIWHIFWHIFWHSIWQISGVDRDISISVPLELFAKTLETGNITWRDLMLDWCLRQSTSHRVSIVYHSYGFVEFRRELASLWLWFRGPLAWFSHVCTNMFDRRRADMFGHVCLFGSGGPLACLVMFKQTCWELWSLLHMAHWHVYILFDSLTCTMTCQVKQMIGIVSWAKVPWQKLQTKVVSTSCFEMSWWGSLEVK